MSDFVAKIQAALPTGLVIDDPIDKGGQGAVFRGRLNGKVVAIKLFHPDCDLRRLQRELEVLSKIDCDYLVKVKDSFTVSIDGLRCPLVAYEYLGGGDLKKLLIPTQPPADYATILTIGSQVSTAIRELWNRRIVHRDIKPANIVDAGAGRYVLVDVGFARHLDRSDITAVGLAPGTAGYKSPEQAKGLRNLTTHSDVFSLGVTLYELAAKRHPFGRVQRSIGVISPPKLSDCRTDFPNGLTKLIHQMMSIRPAQRPIDACQRFRQLQDE